MYRLPTSIHPALETIEAYSWRTDAPICWDSKERELWCWDEAQKAFAIVDMSNIDDAFIDMFMPAYSCCFRARRKEGFLEIDEELENLVPEQERDFMMAKLGPVYRSLRPKKKGATLKEVAHAIKAITQGQVKLKAMKSFNDYPVEVIFEHQNGVRIVLADDSELTLFNRFSHHLKYHTKQIQRANLDTLEEITTYEDFYRNLEEIREKE